MSGSRKVWAAISCMLVLAAGAAPARAQSITRAAPFEFGCLDLPPCDPGWEPARQGIIETTDTTYPCIVYGPPLVWICEYTYFGSTGVFQETTERGDLLVTVKAHVIAPSLSAGPTYMCAGIGWLAWLTYWDYTMPSQACEAFGEDGTVTSTYRFTDLPPRKYAIFATMGSRNALLPVVVDSIMYGFEAAP